jgi:hypothetical protein
MRYSCALYSLIYSVSIYYIHKQTLIYHNPCLHTAIYLLIYLVYNLVYKDLCIIVYKDLCIVYKVLCIVYKLLGPLTPSTPHFYIPLYYLIFHLYTLIFSLTYPYIPRQYISVWSPTDVPATTNTDILRRRLFLLIIII